MEQETAPHFCLPSLDGETVCRKDLLGKVVLLSFWVTWCPSCQADLPQKEVFASSLDANRFAFYTVNVTGREADPDQVRPFMRENGYRFPVLLDDGRSVYDAFGITSVPTSILIDSQGRVAGRFDETVPFVQIVEEIGRLLQR
ncbi:TlpA family protein disulfide reductase [Salinithrix halophila]|uniref:TlpA family protein disulfide reductase n=1 Tax=Salinithrix halophila TaxID=1485204 RepID=A0ABV8JBJ0_9BACL